jgi:hypothetical protein
MTNKTRLLMAISLSVLANAAFAMENIAGSPFDEGDFIAVSPIGPGSSHLPVGASSAAVCRNLFGPSDAPRTPVRGVAYKSPPSDLAFVSPFRAPEGTGALMNETPSRAFDIAAASVSDPHTSISSKETLSDEAICDLMRSPAPVPSSDNSSIGSGKSATHIKRMKEEADQEKKRKQATKGQRELRALGVGPTPKKTRSGLAYAGE